jgi:transposase
VTARIRARREIQAHALKRWAEHLADTRGKRIAVVALARKLAGVLWAMWRDGTVYDRAEQAEKAARGVNIAARKQCHRADALERAAKKLRRKEITESTSSSKRASKARSTSSEMNAT